MTWKIVCKNTNGFKIKPLQRRTTTALHRFTFTLRVLAGVPDSFGLVSGFEFSIPVLICLPALDSQELSLPHSLSLLPKETKFKETGFILFWGGMEHYLPFK